MTIAQRGSRARSPTAILIVDADQQNRELYAELFRRTGRDVVQARDGREALASALHTAPALVLTELSLPMIDGCSLCEVLRQDRATQHVPIVVVTAETRSGPIARVRSAGAACVFVKPVPVDRLLAEVQRLLALSESGPPQGGEAPRATDTQLRCPTCDRLLVFESSHSGGVSGRPEQWDYFLCPGTCGRFQYRHRTRKLRHIAPTWTPPPGSSSG